MWGAAAKLFAFFFLLGSQLTACNRTAYTYNGTRTSATELKHAIAVPKPIIECVQQSCNRAATELKHAIAVPELKHVH